MDAHNASHLSVRGSRVERMHRRHCSLKKGDKTTNSQCSNIIHVTIRKAEEDQLHHQKNPNVKHDLLSISTILSARNRQTQLNQPSFRSMRSNISRDMSSPSNDSNISRHPSVLEISPNSWDCNEMNINSTKGRNLNLTNEENQMNINERPHSNARVRHITPDIISSRVIPNQDNLVGKISAKESIPVLNETNNMNDNGRSNRLDLMTHHSNFRANYNDKKNSKRKNCFWPSTRPCVFCTILTALLLGAAIGATIAGVLSQQKSTTITTGITTTATTVTTTRITTTTSVTTTSTTT